MKISVLLIDESLTVQKVVALTLDRNIYQVHYAKSRSEAMKMILENTPSLILLSDQVNGIQALQFPQEVESWVGAQKVKPPVILITTQDLPTPKNYQAVLKKPFSPQLLQKLVAQYAMPPRPTSSETKELPEDEGNLQKIFDESFPDEGKLTRETLQEIEIEDERTQLTYVPPVKPAQVEVDNEMRSVKPNIPPPPPTAAELWGVEPKKKTSPLPEKKENREATMDASASMAYKAVLEKQVENQLGQTPLEEMVKQVLDRILPPIVEKIVHERLDDLLKEQEDFLELKQ